MNTSQTPVTAIDILLEPDATMLRSITMTPRSTQP